ncbi:MAG: Hsp20/alpha crystallin family protein [Candidatus Edwardsbacteria bacterium]
MWDLIQWDPFQELTSFKKEMERLFDTTFGRLPARKTLAQELWAPLVDMEETKDEVIVKAEIPGMKKEEIKISVSRNTLAITGERRHEAETKDKTFHRIERSYGKFQRIISLPAGVVSGKAKATYEGGVLTIKLPKSEEAKPKEIAIEVK